MGIILAMFLFLVDSVMGKAAIHNYLLILRW